MTIRYLHPVKLIAARGAAKLLVRDRVREASVVHTDVDAHLRFFSSFLFLRWWILEFVCRRAARIEASTWEPWKLQRASRLAMYYAQS